MEKLELKHIAPYLPYKLKVKTPYGVDVPKVGHIYTMMGVSFKNKGGLGHDLYFEFEEKLGKEMSMNYNEFKPVLMPLIYLTKEIEIDGEKFIPIEKLKLEYDWSDYISIYDFATEQSLGMEDIYFVVDKLYEWHFDVFGLIEKGLAVDMKSIINIDTLK
jgi:hypothetical protein